MRSLLFVPADSFKKLEKGLTTPADCLILDLEDSVALNQKPTARTIAAHFLAQPRAKQKLYVRVNALDTSLTQQDLEAVIPHKPDGIMLPKSLKGADIALLDLKITALEAIHGLPEGKIKLLPVATETAEAIFGLQSYKNASPRLIGLTWGAEDLSADLGAQTNRGEDGRHTEPFRLARNLMLMGAVNAGVMPIDTVYPQFKNESGFRLECIEALRDGFVGKMAIHPAQVDIINEVFTPSQEAVAQAKAIVEAFAANPQAGVIAFNNEMYDMPHLRRAKMLLQRAV
jgi:citrate lyase subunit beta / citryl-CoA lyase